MRELETSLHQFGEFLLKAQLVKEKAAPYCVRFVRRFRAIRIRDRHFKRIAEDRHGFAELNAVLPEPELITVNNP